MSFESPSLSCLRTWLFSEIFINNVLFSLTLDIFVNHWHWQVVQVFNCIMYLEPIKNGFFDCQSTLHCLHMVIKWLVCRKKNKQTFTPGLLPQNKQGTDAYFQLFSQELPPKILNMESLNMGTSIPIHLGEIIIHNISLRMHRKQKAAWPSASGHWCCYLEVMGSSPPSCH